MLGLGVLVLADALADQAAAREGSASHSVTGDLLCLAGSFLYAASNVCQEVMVKCFDRVSAWWCDDCTGWLP